MYKFLRAILFVFDPERVHYFSMNCLRLGCKIPFTKKIISQSFRPKGDHHYSIFNIQFPNRVGLGAGFDKNAKYLTELEALGFGFVEIGTVTPLPQDGNGRPRLFRLPKDKALINRMGFNNDGAQVIAERLKMWRQSATGDRQFPFPASRLPIDGSRLIIGGNIGKNKQTPNEKAWKDYEACFLALHDYVDYFVVNVSSPNTPGLRALQEKDSLAKILKNLQSHNRKKENPKPILLKIAPDLTHEQLDDVIDLALEINLEGLIVSNTTITRGGLKTPLEELVKIGAGGLSGLPVRHKSTEIIKYISTTAGNKIRIIGSGGIFNGADAAEKIKAGASLVQVWTGFIYEGPSIVKRISAYLAAGKHTKL
jgi:dihydroorotate dehydrogenase